MRKLAVAAVLIVVPILALARFQRPAPAPVPVVSEETVSPDVIPAHLRNLTLAYDENMGYIRSLLKALNIPESSQAFVFGRNSFQIDQISPSRPRAVYFNDDTYVGFVQGGRFIEIAIADPEAGPVFFTLDQKKVEKPTFLKETSNCLVCHDSGGNGIPRLLVLSTIPDAIGTAMGQTVYSNDDGSPLKERFGGWYVTGTHGNQRHMGNVFAPRRTTEIRDVNTYAKQFDMTTGGNVTDLSKFFDTKPYPTPHSDIVAHLVLAHQTHVHNVIARAVFKVDEARKERLAPEQVEKVIKDYGEPIIETMFFSGAAPFEDPIQGTTTFASEFAAAGKRDSKGRSLKDLDLKTRLMKYPLSYIVYTDSFKKMPANLKAYVDRRFREVLSGEDKSAAFAHLSASDRAAISEILADTQ